ncbi:MAG: MFS transporter [Pirellulales bacterium]
MNRLRILPLMMVFAAWAHFNRLSMAVAGAEQIVPGGLLSKTQMGWVYTTTLAVYTLCMIPGGWLVDRWGPHRSWILLASGSAILMAAVGLLGAAVAEPTTLLIGLLVVRGLFGAVTAPLHPTAARLVHNWSPASFTDSANGLVTAACCLGMATTYLLFGWLIDWLAWPGAFLAAAGVTAVVGWAWYRHGADFPPDSLLKAGHEASRVASVRQIVGPESDSGLEPGAGASTEDRSTEGESNWSLVCLTASYGMVGYFQYLFFYWAEHYFQETLRLDTSAARWATSLLTLAMGVGMLLGGRFSDYARGRWSGWLGMALVPVAGLTLAGGVTAIGAYISGAALVIGCFATAMVAVGLSEAAHWSTAVRLGNERGGAAAAIMNTGGNGVGLLAPVLTPVIGETLGWRFSLLVAAAACGLAAIAWLGIRRRG